MRHHSFKKGQKVIVELDESGKIIDLHHKKDYHSIISHLNQREEEYKRAIKKLEE